MAKISSNKKEFLFAGIAWWIIISIVYSLILTGILKDKNITTVQIVADAFLNNLFLLACWMLIINNMRYYLPRRERYWYILIISVTLSILSTWIARLLLQVIFVSDKHYSDVLIQTSSFRFEISFLLIACMAVMSLFWFSQQEQKEMNERKADAERLSKEAELFKLRQQLQPHFLFNSLNSISALTGTQPEKARHMIQQLSDFFRGTLKKEDNRWSSLKEEIEYLELYLEIEKVRFGHRLQTKIECDEDCLQMKLPSLLLQPVVENAIKFGLYDTIGDVLVTIEAKSENDILSVIIANPFDAETAQPLPGTGFGLSSIQRRLFLLFARKDLLQTKIENGHFFTSIIIPQITSEQNENNNN